MIHPLLSNALSWQLAAALVRMAKTTLVVRETHPGGGQYDCLELREGDDRQAPALISINRAGSIHFAANDAASVPDEEWAQPRSASEFSDFVARLLRSARVEPLSRSRPTDRAMLTLRLAAELVAATALTDRPWDARAALQDSSGPGGSSVHEGATRGFPGVSVAPSHAVWLLGPLGGGGDPVRLHNAYAINGRAEVLDLHHAYRRHMGVPELATRLRLLR